MTKTDVADIILPELNTLFSRPTGLTNEMNDIALKVYIEELKDFTPEELSAGWKNVKCSYRKTVRPPLAIIRQACMEVREQNAPPVPVKASVTEKKAFATEQGRMALRAGVGPQWFKTCQIRQRILSEEETLKEIKLAQRGERPDLKTAPGWLRDVLDRVEGSMKDNNKILSDKYR